MEGRGEERSGGGGVSSTTSTRLPAYLFVFTLVAHVSNDNDNSVVVPIETRELLATSLTGATSDSSMLQNSGERERASTTDLACQSITQPSTGINRVENNSRHVKPGMGEPIHGERDR